MRRLGLARGFPVMLLSVLAGALILGAAVARVDARQQGTPAPGAGVSTEVLGRMEVASAPGQALHLLRVTFEPGGSVAAHAHPGTTIYHLASGTLGFTLVEGEAHLVRAGTDTAAATPPAAESIAIDAEITLTAGDTVYYDGSTVQVERNDGDDPAVVLVSNLRGIDEPARELFDPAVSYSAVNAADLLLATTAEPVADPATILGNGGRDCIACALAAVDTISVSAADPDDAAPANTREWAIPPSPGLPGEPF